MLVLARRVGEEMLIADNIRVTVVAIRGNHVRLGITAPPSVPVARLELLAKRAETTGATTTGCWALPSSVEQKKRRRRRIAPSITKGRG
jgi:carbon storage regulator